jgi:hypothetical protein
VGHQDEGNTQRALQLFELFLHLLAEAMIQGGEGFIEEQDPGFVDQGTGNGNPLLLASGERRGSSLFQT